uniref:Uncharacterized protein n=1 Tax=Anguilla anguilla TaxID=7936 RepID=A0A0E9R0H1_ANGAN
MSAVRRVSIGFTSNALKKL